MRLVLVKERVGLVRASEAASPAALRGRAHWERVTKTSSTRTRKLCWKNGSGTKRTQAQPKGVISDRLSTAVETGVAVPLMSKELSFFLLISRRTKVLALILGVESQF